MVEKLYTTLEVAAHFDVTRISVLRWVRRGWLKKTKDERGNVFFTEKDVKEFENGRFARRWESKRKDYRHES